MSSWTSSRRMIWSESCWSRRKRASKMIHWRSLMRLSWTEPLPNKPSKKYHSRIKSAQKSTPAILTATPRSKPLQSSRNSNFQTSSRVQRIRHRTLARPAKWLSWRKSRVWQKLKNWIPYLIRQRIVRHLIWIWHVRPPISIWMHQQWPLKRLQP